MSVRRGGWTDRPCDPPRSIRRGPRAWVRNGSRWDDLGYHGLICPVKHSWRISRRSGRNFQGRIKGLSGSVWRVACFTFVLPRWQRNRCIGDSVGIFRLGGVESVRWPVSRVLSRPCGHERPFLWDGPCGPPHATDPDGGRECPCAFRRTVPMWSCSRWGLPCRPCCQGRGALLPHRFALARGVTRPCAGGLFSVALSLGSPPPAVSRHRIPVEPGLSSIPRTRGTAAARPPDGLEMRPTQADVKQ